MKFIPNLGANQKPYKGSAPALTDRSQARRLRRSGGFPSCKASSIPRSRAGARSCSRPAWQGLS